MIETGEAGKPRSVKWAPAASSCGVNDRSAPSAICAAAGSGPNMRNSPTHTGAPVPLFTLSWAYLAWVPGGTWMYMGLPGSSATFCAVGSVVHCPEFVASWMVASADGLAASRVMPRPSRERTWPRSMVRVPSHAFGCASVLASPSIALDAGSPDWDVSALAWPDSAQLMLGPCAQGQSRCGPRRAGPATGRATPAARAAAAVAPCPGNGEVPAAPPAGPAAAAPAPATRIRAAGAAARAAVRASLRRRPPRPVGGPLNRRKRTRRDRFGIANLRNHTKIKACAHNNAHRTARQWDRVHVSKRAGARGAQVAARATGTQPCGTWNPGRGGPGGRWALVWSARQ